MSQDTGQTWISMNNGLNNLEITTITIAGGKFIVERYMEVFISQVTMGIVGQNLTTALLPILAHN